MRKHLRERKSWSVLTWMDRIRASGRPDQSNKEENPHGANAVG